MDIDEFLISNDFCHETGKYSRTVQRLVAHLTGIILGRYTARNVGLNWGHEGQTKFSIRRKILTRSVSFMLLSAFNVSRRLIFRQQQFEYSPEKTFWKRLSVVQVISI